MSQSCFKLFTAVLAIVCLASLHDTALAEVFVDLSDEGELTIIGDDDPNSVFIEVDDQLTVSTSSPGAHSFDVLAITKLSIQLGKDIDVVHITLYQSLIADISISTGQERDVVTLHDSEPGGVEYSNFVIGDVTINTGHGDDGVRLSSMGIWGDVGISSGNGRDLIELNTDIYPAAQRGANDIIGSLSINTGVRQDRVSFYGFATNVEDDLLIELGQGDDSIGTSLFLYEENDVGGIAYLSGGQGFDTCPDDVVTASEIIKIGFED